MLVPTRLYRELLDIERSLLGSLAFVEVDGAETEQFHRDGRRLTTWCFDQRRSGRSSKSERAHAF